MIPGRFPTPLPEKVHLNKPVYRKCVTCLNESDHFCVQIYLRKRETVCKAYDCFRKQKIPIPTPLLERALRLIQWKKNIYLQTDKMTVACANIFMAKVETNILNKSALKPLVWKRFTDDIWELKHKTFFRHGRQPEVGCFPV